MSIKRVSVYRECDWGSPVVNWLQLRVIRTAYENSVTVKVGGVGLSFTWWAK